jgi:hemolysin activation/secretion protein
MLRFILVLFLFAWGCLHQKSSAQVPNPIFPNPNPLPRVQPLPETPEVLFPLPPAAPNPPELPQTLVVSRFEFQGNTAFSDEDLRQAVAPFSDRPLTFAELLQAEAAINQLYLQSGYINSGAVIPADQVLWLDRNKHLWTRRSRLP